MTDLNELYRQLSCGSIFSDKILGEPRRHQWRSPKPQTPKEPNNGEEESNVKIENVAVTTTMDEHRVRKLNGINVKGKNIPKPIVDFKQLIEEYKISPILYDNILKCDYKTPTPIQMQAIPNLISKQSTIGIATTGSGKTAAFLVPIINALKRPKAKGFRAMILCPTRELAKQTQRECLRLVDGGIDLIVHTLSKTNDAEKKYGDKSNKKYDILVTTPNRVCYLLSQKPPQLNLTNVKWLILDEADKLFQTGKNSFLDQFKLIYAECTNPKITIGLFSATTSLQVIRCFRKLFKPKKIVQIIIGERNSSAKSVEQEIRFTGNELGKLMAFRELVNKGIRPPVLIFVETKDRAEQLYSELKYDAINIDLIHGDRTQQERDKIVNDFREGKIWFLICTELISRGIDFKGINLVLNYDFPESSTSYIHRVGRAGRANLKGKALTFVTFEDLENLRSIARIVENAGGKVPEYMLKLKKKSKRELLKSAKTKLKRDDICTNPDIKKWKKGGGKQTVQKSKMINGNGNQEEVGKYVKINSNGNEQKSLNNKNKTPISLITKNGHGNDDKNKTIVKNQIKLNGNNRKRKIEEKTNNNTNKKVKLNQQKKKRKI